MVGFFDYQLIYLLLLILIVNFWFSIRFFSAKFNPASISSFGFMVAAFMCVIYKQEWEMFELSQTTFLLLSLGITVFTLTCFIADTYMRQKKFKRLENYRISYLSKDLFWLICIYEIFAYFIVYRYVLSTTGISDLSRALEELSSSKFDGYNYYKKPWFVSFNEFNASAIVYWALFNLSKMIALKENKGQIIRLAIIGGIGFVGSFLSGSRGGAIYMIIFAIFAYFVLRIKLTYPIKRNKIRLKKVVLYFVGIYVGILGFAKTTEIMGHGQEVAENPIYYFAMYCGAEIRNLDIFIANKNMDSKYWGEFTFLELYGSTKHFKDHIVTYLHPFNMIKGNSLGNVSTCFSHYYQDFGFKGSIILQILIAILMSFLFYKVLASRTLSNWTFDFWVYIYVFLLQGLAFTFFSNRFFEWLIYVNFKRVFYIFLISYILDKMITKRKTHIELC